MPIRRWSCPDVKRMSLLSRWQKEPALKLLSDLKNAKGRLSNTDVMDVQQRLPFEMDNSLIFSPTDCLQSEVGE